MATMHNLGICRGCLKVAVEELAACIKRHIDVNVKLIPSAGV